MANSTDAPPDAVEEARRLYRMRRMRDAQFGAELFGEPAWDLLLDLYITRGQNELGSSIGGGLAAFTPSATAAPYIVKLRECGLVEPAHTSKNSTAALVTLSDSGFERMTALLLGDL
jgi:hypothetical protein